MIKKIKVDEITNIELINENHSQSIFELIDSNRSI